MATWDGSYVEDSNYFMYSDQNVSDTAAENWTYFGGDPAYLRDTSMRNYYLAAGDQQLYEQNKSVAAFHQVVTNSVIPSISSNVVPLRNTYQEHILPSTTSVNNAPSDNLQYSVDNIASISHTSSPLDNNDKSKYRKKKMTNKYTLSSDANNIKSDIVKNSKLHPTANEFVPNNIKFKKDGPNKWNGRDNTTENSFNVSTQNFRLKTFAMNASASDNKHKDESCSNNKKYMNYKQKNPQQTMQTSSRSNYKDKSYNIRNYNKFQNGKYNRKYQSNTSSIEQGATREAHTSMTEFAASSAFNSQQNKCSIKEIQKDDLSSNTKMSTYKKISTNENKNLQENASTLKINTQRNSRSKRFNTSSNPPNLNYYKNNFYDGQAEPVKHKTAANTRYMRRRNNEANINNKEKIENWRDRTENKEIVQGKNLSKKYGIGIFIDSLE